MKKVFLKIIVILIMLVLAYSTVVNALSFTATMTPSSTTVAESTEFVIVIKVSNLDVGQNGINSLSGYLKYDTSVFELISDSSIEGLNGWSPNFTSENGKINLTKTSFVKSEEAVFQVTFKTKTGVSGKTGDISYSSILASNSQQDIFATDISTTITIGNAPVGNTTNTTTNTQTIVPILPSNTVKNTTVNNVANNTVVNKVGNLVSNTANKVSNSTYTNKAVNNVTEEIPYTGTEDTVMYVMIVALALALIFYIKFQKINKELK